MSNKRNLYRILLLLILAIFGAVMYPIFSPEEKKQNTSADTEHIGEQGGSGPDEAELLAQWKGDIKPMLEHYCYDCHGDGSSKGKLDLDEFPDIASMRKNPKIWEHIQARVNYHLMPPPKEEQPTKEERKQLASWINHAVFPVDASNPPIGKPTIRRLNLLEYSNTIEDLLGVRLDVKNLLPPDDSGYGFDNIGSVLSISPSHIEKYLLAAEQAVDMAMRAKPREFDLQRLAGGGHRNDQGAFMFKNADVIVNPRLTQPGMYTLHVSASAQQAGDELARLEILHNAKVVRSFKVAQRLGNQKTYSVQLRLKKGFNDVRVRFPNDFYDPRNPNPKKRDRNLMIHSIAIEAPAGIATSEKLARRRFFKTRGSAESDADYARGVVRRFASLAFRRPPLADETARYTKLALRLAKEQGSLEEGLLGTMQAMLVSPSFLYIAPVASKETPENVDEFTLASRLSYFLWSSMPDQELLSLAGNGRLRAELDSQITRMLKSKKAQSMTRSFTGQWLQLRDLEVVAPDNKTFRPFNGDLRQAMRRETEMFVDYILLENKSLLDIVNADYTFLNARLASYYGIKGIKHREFKMVKHSDPRRRGILTHGSILTLTSTPTRTSPVLRGKYVLENILDITPPPPPPNLPALDDPHQQAKITLRQQLANHRKKTACAGCHNLMDPVGLAFENYDAIGRWREFELGKKIDASGQLVTGEKLHQASDLIRIISENKRDEFLRCVIRKMLTYALGRGVTRQDRIYVEKILSHLHKKQYHSHDLIRAIAKSRPFQMH